MLVRRHRALLAVAVLATLGAACGAPDEVGDAGRGDTGRADAQAQDVSNDDVSQGDDVDQGDDVFSGDDTESLDAVDESADDAESLDAMDDGGGDDGGGMSDAGTDGGAVHCTSPQVNCGGACVNRQTDERNCGACGHMCPSGAMCMNGSCSLNATCAPLHFPSVSIQTIPVASMTTAYRSIASGSCFPVPNCFIDLNHLEDPDTGRSLDVHVNLSPHFTLYELVGTELAGGYTHYALLSPSLISHLESLRMQEGGHGITIASGYRSPQHQAATCRSICPGGASCCPTAAHPCGCRSEHEWGRAADLSIPSTEYTAYGNDAHAVHFPDCLLEAGSFHVDVSPCPLGCPYHF